MMIDPVGRPSTDTDDGDGLENATGFPPPRPRPARWSILMPSPFPGMNPWIEQGDLWPDFHVAFVPALRRQLARQVVPRYIVLMEEQIYIHECPSGPARSIRPDVAVTRPRGGPAAAAVGLAEIEAPTHPSLPAED